MSGTTTTGSPATINAVIQFSGATGATWTNLTVPVPSGLITIESDTGIMKRGDGVTLYSNLPVFFNLSTLTTLMSNVLQKNSPLAQTTDLTSTTGIFSVNAAGNVVLMTPADLFSWLINSAVIKNVAGVVEVGP